MAAGGEPMDQKLLLVSAEFLDLNDEIALLTALGETAAGLKQAGGAVEGFTTAEAFLKAAVKEASSPAVAEAFRRLGLSGSLEELQALLGKVTDAAGELSPQARRLLEPLGGFEGGDGATVEWSLDGAKQIAGTSGRFDLALDIGAKAALAFEAGCKWPKDDAGAKPLLRIGAEGEVKAGAQAKARFLYGALSGGAGGSAGAQLDYYFDAPDDALFGLAAARALKGVVNPFGLTEVWAAFADPDLKLEAIVYHLGTGAKVNVEVKFADPKAILAGLPANLDLTVGVAASLDTSYGLTLRRAAGTPGLSAQLSRSRIDERNFEAALKLEVDVEAIAGPVADAVGKAVAQWDAALADIKPYLSPGTWLRDQAGKAIADRLETRIKDAALREAVLADAKGALGLGEVGDPAIAKWLSGKVTEAVGKARALIDANTAAVADAALADLEKQLPIVAQTPLRADVEALVKDSVGKLEASLADRAKALVAARPAGELKAILEKAGATVDAAVTTADDALKGLRSLLDHYDGTIRKVAEFAKKAAKERLKIRFFLEESRTNGEVVEFGGVFTGAGPDCRRVFEALTRGAFDGLLTVIDRPQDTPGFQLDEDSFLKRYSRFKSTDGLEVVFLDLKLTSTTVIDVNAEVVIDGHGDLKLDDTATLKKTLLTNDCTREVSFTDTHALVLAGEARRRGLPGVSTLEVAVGAVYGDGDLDWSEITQFIAGLDKAHLLAVQPGKPTVAERAQARFDAWSGGGGKFAGEISVRFKVDGPQAERLLLLGQRDPATHRLTDAGKRTVIRVAMQALREQERFQAKEFAEGEKLAAGAFIRRRLPKTEDEMILLLDQGISRDDLPRNDDPPRQGAGGNMPVVMSSETSQRRYVYFLRQCYAVERLHRLIDKMGEVYLQAPAIPGAAGGWSETQYADAQIAIARNSRPWLAVADTVASVFSGEVSWRTIALIRALANLSGHAADRPGGVVVSLNRKSGGDQEETVAFD